MADASLDQALGGVSQVARPTRRELLHYGAGAAAAGAMVSIHGTAFATQRRNVVVESVYGKLRGTVAAGVAAFKGISYGQSTAGRNRFLPPQPVKPWAGVREATQLGHPSVQDNPDFTAWLDPMPGSEDCLALNIWAPETARPASKLPVMIFIHGGGYTFGSGGAPLYDGGILAKTGNVVAITLNHRLQAFGFTDLSVAGGEAYAGSGNAGMLDIVAALRWVRDNIKAFGGDPANVTLFGQSGGGAKISTLMAMPIASGLFHRAIVQSGSVFRYRGRAEAEATTERMFSILGIARNDISALQAVPADVLLASGAQIINETTGLGHSSLKYAPVIDGDFIPEMPWRAGAPLLSKHVPLMVGTTLDETIIYLQNEGSIAASIVNSTSAYTPVEARVAELIPYYQRVTPNLSREELIVRISTDISYWKEAVHQAEMQSKVGAPVYMYRCDWKTPCFGGMWAPHSLELPFIFGHKYYGAAWDGKDDDAARAAADPANDRFRLGDQMLAAWANFAKGGDPSLPDLAWPAYDVDKRATMIFDSESKVINDPQSEFRTLVSPL